MLSNQFFFGFFFYIFSVHFEPQKKKNLRVQKETMMMKMRITKMILALLLLFATTFSQFVHGFYLPGVAPQGTNFLSLCVCLFVCSSSCAECCLKRQRIKSRTCSLGSHDDADLFLLSFSFSFVFLRPTKQFYDAHIKQITRKTTSCS